MKKSRDTHNQSDDDDREQKETTFHTWMGFRERFPSSLRVTHSPTSYLYRLHFKAFGIEYTHIYAHIVSLQTRTRTHLFTEKAYIERDLFTMMMSTNNAHAKSAMMTMGNARSNKSIRSSSGVVSSHRRAAALFTTKTNRRMNNSSRMTITRASGADDIVIVDDASFEKEVLQSETPVLIDFWATWCGPCKLISKVVEKAAPEYKGNLKIVKIETDPNPVLVEKYEVYGLPTLMVFKDGQPVKGSKREGAINLAKLKDYLQSHGISPA